MTTYLLKSGLCLLVVLGFYAIWLEKERMHRFNRWYLLGGVLCSAVVPLLTFRLWPIGTGVPLLEPMAVPAPGGAVFPAATPQNGATESAGFPFGWVLYAGVTAAMLARFGLNLRAIFRKITAHPKQACRGATLVLLNEAVLPHTFLRYVFVSETAFRRGEIEDELLTHELAHVRQGHSLDVLLLEVLLCFGWFNPLLFWCKRAIQLTHEFLADEAVLRTRPDVTDYQRLLLGKLAPAPPVALTSSFSFQTTKQRLLMMTRHTPPTRAWLAGSSATLLLAALILLLGTTTEAQVPPPAAKQTPVAKKPQPTTDVAEMERLYGDKLVMMPGQNSPRKKFSELSASEKERVQRVPPLPRQVPTEAQMNEWKNPKKFGIWLDEKRIPNARLSRYAATDIASYWVSYVHKNARQPENYLYQVDLSTKSEYEKYLAEDAKNPLLVLRLGPKPKGQ